MKLVRLSSARLWTARRAEPSITNSVNPITNSVCGKSSHLFEVLPCVGSLPIYSKSSHIRQALPPMGSLPICGKPYHVGEVFPYMGKLHMYGKPSPIWEASHVGEVFPYMGSLPICCKRARLRKVFPYIYIWEAFPYIGAPGSGLLGRAGDR